MLLYGATLADDTLGVAGSVGIKPFLERGFIIGGNLAEVIVEAGGGCSKTFQ